MSSMCLPLAANPPKAQALEIQAARAGQDSAATLKSSFGGAGDDSFLAVAATADGCVAVGNSAESSFGTGDWAGTEGKGARDAAIVKYDAEGKVVWKKNFGGSDDDSFSAVAAVEGGYVAAGVSASGSFGTGDWTGTEGKGDRDAIIVKYDEQGNVVWKKNFGGSDWDGYLSVAVTEDGYVAAGYAYNKSFGNGDWAGSREKSTDKEDDAVIVKYDTAGNVLWQKSFGGDDYDCFCGVAPIESGCVAVGYSGGGSFGTGDWTGTETKDQKNLNFSNFANDAIIVGYDHAGKILWKKNFGGGSYDEFAAVAAASDGFVAAGYSYMSSFGTGDWIGAEGKGHDDAVIVKFDMKGNIQWKKSLGGNDADYYEAVTAVNDGYIAAGRSNAESFGTGDWTGIEGNDDAVVAKYSLDGKLLWKKNFGGGESDRFQGAAAVEEGFLVAGYSESYGFGIGDWAGASGKGGDDAVIVAYAESGQDADNPALAADFSYETLEDGAIEIKRYTGVAESLSVPTKIEGKAVTSIGPDAFYGRNVLKSINLPQSITDINRWAFRSCSNLKNIDVSEDNMTFRSYDGCLYTKDGSELLWCPSGKTEASLLEGLKTITKDAFSDCSRLASVSIPQSVAEIEYAAFASCGSLKNVYYAGSASQWKKIDIGGRNEKLTDAVIYYASGGVSPDPDRKPTGLKLSKKSLSLKKGGKKKLAYTFTPSGTSAEVSFTTSNPSVAAVSKSGLVTAKKKGTATITAKASGLKATCKVTVTEEQKLKTPSLTVKLDSANGVKLTWKRISGAQGYYIYRSTSKGGSYAKIKTVKGTSFVNNKLKSGKTYYYKVAAYKGSKESARSKAASKKILGKPAAPKMHFKPNPSSKVFTITWSAVKGADMIEIVRETGDGIFKKWKTVSARNKKASYPYPKAGTKWKFALRAYYVMDGKIVYSENSNAYTASF